MTSTIRNVAAAGLAVSLLGMAAGAVHAAGATLINQCDRVCASNARAICYQACLSGAGQATARRSTVVLPPTEPPQKPAIPNVLGSAKAKSTSGDWRDAVYASPSRSGPSSAGGGGGGGGKAK